MGTTVFSPALACDVPIVAVEHTLTEADLAAMKARQRVHRLSKSRINKTRRRLGLGPVEDLRPGTRAYTLQAG